MSDEYHVFDSADALLTRLEDDTPWSKHFGYRSSTDGSREFCKTGSYLEADALAREGWTGPQVEVDRFVAHVEQRIDASVLQTTFDHYYDVAGSEVDVARYLSGDPECMIESTPIRISRHGRAVRLVIPLVFNCGVGEREINGRGAAIVALADVLARAQHPLEIWGAFSYGTGHMENGVSFCTYVRLQRADEPLDVPRLNFWAGHPSSLRRIGFRACEKLVESPTVSSKIGGCYGYTPKRIDQHVRAELPDQAENTITIPGFGSGEWSKDADTIRWSDEATASAWVEDTLDGIFG